MSHAVFSSGTCRHPLLRTALLMANFTTSKKDDGIARLLVKSDVARIAQTRMEATCQEAHDALKDAMDIKTSLVKPHWAKKKKC